MPYFAAELSERLLKLRPEYQCHFISRLFVLVALFIEMGRNVGISSEKRLGA